jgi:hypothetical protein
MTNEYGNQAETAVFAADGPGRHRLLRVALVGGSALLAAWLIALALGVLGGFAALPGLPRSSSENSSAATHPAAQHEPPASQATRSSQSAASAPGGSVAKAPTRAAAPAKVKRPAATPAPTTKPGRRTGQVTGGNRPAVPPGQGPDGTGPPGQN